MTWSLNLDFTSGAMICGFLSLILTIILYFRRKAKNNELATSPKVTIITFIHYYTTVSSLLYPFIFSARYDLAFIIVAGLTVLHWLILHECVLSYLEKVLLDPSYSMGYDKYRHPFINDLISSETELAIFYTVQRMSTAMVICFVLLRYGTRTFNKKYHIIVLLVSILLMLYVFYHNMVVLQSSYTSK
jgi:hypothetical protein